MRGITRSGRARVVVLSGAGISRESGLQTFRDGDGLWEGHRVEDVATPEAWAQNQQLVLEFYNERRRALLQAEPNAGHRELVRLEDQFDVQVITQNIDDLHERAGSSTVLHLHGELRKAQSTVDPSLIYPISGSELAVGESCEKGSQLRPFVVWFGEPVPMIEQAAKIVAEAEWLIVVGTSLAVYPAANLIYHVSPQCKVVVIDPKPPAFNFSSAVEFRTEPATVGLRQVVDDLIATVR